MEHSDGRADQGGIAVDGWTPRRLLEAARRHGGENEAENVWSMMLDNTALGLRRSFWTTENLARSYNDELLNASTYFTDMAIARGAALSAVPNTDPDTIRLDGTDYNYNAVNGSWQGPAPIESRITVKLNISDPALIDRLNEARDVRLEREQMRSQFHPDDPNQNRPIKESPFLLSEAGHAIDPNDSSHPRNGLFQQCVAGVQRIDATLNRTWDSHSACMAASLTTLAASGGLDRVDHVLLSQQGTEGAAGERVFVLQGDPNDPTHRRASMPTESAIGTLPEHSFQQLAQLDQVRSQEQAQQQARDLEQTILPPMMQR